MMNRFFGWGIYASLLFIFLAILFLKNDINELHFKTIEHKTDGDNYSNHTYDPTDVEELKHDIKDIKAIIDSVPVRFFTFLGQIVHYLTVLGVGMEEEQQKDVVEILEGTSEDINEVLEEVMYACEMLGELVKLLMGAMVVLMLFLGFSLIINIHNAYYLHGIGHDSR